MGVLWQFHRDARLFARSVSALALPAIPVGRMHDIAKFRDRYRNATIIRRLIPVVTFPSGTIVGFQDMRILGNFDGDVLIF